MFAFVENIIQKIAEYIYPVPDFIKAQRPRIIATIVVQAGKKHKHNFHYVPWDYDRFGPSFIPEEDDPNNTAMARAIFKDLYRCSCGEERVTETDSIY